MFWSVEEFCDGFLKLIDHLELDKVQSRYVWYEYHLPHTQALQEKQEPGMHSLYIRGITPTFLGLGYFWGFLHLLLFPYTPML